MMDCNFSPLSMGKTQVPYLGADEDKIEITHNRIS